MKTTLNLALSLALAFLLAGCDSLPTNMLGLGESKTFEQPVARVRPAFISTLAQMGLPVIAIENRGGNEVIKAGKGDRNVAIELERLSAVSTRVRISGSGDLPVQVMRETERRIGGS
jgi:starvation-inducible outer membrane lipoprotein